MDDREWFVTAATGFRQVLARITAEQLGQHGLGEWDVRSLLGHACRAFSTVEAYLSDAREPRPAISLESPADYFHAAAASRADPALVTQRGRDAGAALGTRPVEAADAIVERVIGLVANTSDDAPVATPLGGMRLAGYLPTRAFEVTVHGIDLARATGQDVPPGLYDCLPSAISLCSALADRESRLTMVLALTGMVRRRSESSPNTG